MEISYGGMAYEFQINQLLRMPELFYFGTENYDLQKKD